MLRLSSSSSTASTRANCAAEGDAPQQRASYVRLRLMRGALAFAAGRLDEAAAAFLSGGGTAAELTVLSADEPKVRALVALGLSPQAARRTLLAHGKDVDAAAAAAVERMQEAAASGGAAADWCVPRMAKRRGGVRSMTRRCRR